MERTSLITFDTLMIQEIKSLYHKSFKKLTTTTIKGLNKMKQNNINKPVTFTAIEKGILQDLLNSNIKQIIKEQEKANRELKKKGLLNKFSPVENLNKYDCFEFEYIEILEKIRDKFKLSNKQNKILNERYN
tara:strand:- start:3140 stop:3535 length:396 start_codon:yes stop_codon:yes gene_type:complete